MPSEMERPSTYTSAPATSLSSSESSSCSEATIVRRHMGQVGGSFCIIHAQIQIQGGMTGSMTCWMKVLQAANGSSLK
jgi:hypothetical protein